MRMLSLVALAITSACGDPLLSGTGYKEPLMTITGVLEPPQSATGFRAEVVWVDPLDERPDVPAAVQAVSSEIHADDSYALHLFAPPPEATFRSLPVPGSPGEHVVFAFGEIVLVDDVDGDGTFAVNDDNTIMAPDKYVSWAGADVVTYVAHGIPTPSATADLLPLITGHVGYHLVAMDCTNPATPLLMDVQPAGQEVGLYVMPPADHILYQRPCLRSHAVPTGAPTGP
jgi:hypothetical protein